MHHHTKGFLAAALLIGSAGAVVAQDMPTTQPNMLLIIREEIKLGRNAEHTKNESGWPAAYEKAKSPDYYLALESMSGGNEVLYIQPLESHAKVAEGMARDQANAALTAELGRLWKADAEFVSAVNTMQLVARPDLSMGAYPDMDRQRFWNLTTFRVRPGHDEHFAAAVKAYIAAAKRSSPEAKFRTYEVMNGAPSGTFVLFGSVENYADFDRVMQSGDATWKGATPDELKALQSFAQQGMISSVTNRYRLSPSMSYVPAATKAKDPKFWAAKP